MSRFRRASSDPTLISGAACEGRADFTTNISVASSIFVTNATDPESRRETLQTKTKTEHSYNIMEYAQNGSALVLIEVSNVRRTAVQNPGARRAARKPNKRRGNIAEPSPEGHPESTRNILPKTIFSPNYNSTTLLREAHLAIHFSISGTLWPSDENLLIESVP